MGDDCKVCLIVDEAFRRLLADSRKQVDAIEPAKMEEVRRKYSAPRLISPEALENMVRTTASEMLAHYRILAVIKSN